MKYVVKRRFIQDCGCDCFPPIQIRWIYKGRGICANYIPFINVDILILYPADNAMTDVKLFHSYE